MQACRRSRICTQIPIANLDDELVSMIIIRSLPSQFASFASSLQLLNKLDKEKLQAAFINEEPLRSRSSTPGSTSVLAASTPQPSASLTCTFCSLPGHAEATCTRYQRFKEQATKDAQEKRRQCSKAKSGTSGSSYSAATAQEAASFASRSTESAGKASVRRPMPSTPSARAAHLLWTADAGATSHMAPHKHWVRSYTPLKIPVCLANDTVIFSAGVGSMVFAPVVEGRVAQAVEFNRVLHVPELGSNLLSVLYLTRHR